MTTNDQPMDHVAPDTESTGNAARSELEKNVTSRSTWIRLIFMIICSVLYAISRFVTAAVVVIQFFYVLLTGNTNEQLKTLGHSLAIYSFEITDYLTFNSDTKPFPFDAAWPTELSRDDSDTSDDG
jgi:uncharacterized protein DUF4389